MTSSWTAESFIQANHVTMTHNTHQIIAATLHTLLQQSYNNDCTPDDDNNTQPDEEVFEEWCTRREKANVHVDDWHKTLSMEILLLVYIRSLRKGNFELYVRLQTTRPISGAAVTTVANCCANCVEPSRPQQWGTDIPFLGKPAMRTRWMASAAPQKSG